MSHTNSTTNYGLPQFVPTDKPFWLTDINGAFSDIDAAIYAAKDAADDAQGDATQALTDAGSASTAAATADAKGSGAISSIADTYDATSTYALNDLVMYNNLLYKNIVAITTPEAWNGTHWTRVTVENIMDADRSNTYTKSETDALLADKASYTAVYNQNLQSIVRHTETVTTGASGNVSTGIANDGFSYVLAAFVSGHNYKVDCWVTALTNDWYLTVRDASTNATINNTVIDIRYLVLRINRP